MEKNKKDRRGLTTALLCLFCAPFCAAVVVFVAGLFTDRFYMLIAIGLVAYLVFALVVAFRGKLRRLFGGKKA